MRKRLAIAGHAEEGLSLIPLLEATCLFGSGILPQGIAAFALGAFGKRHGNELCEETLLPFWTHQLERK